MIHTHPVIEIPADTRFRRHEHDGFHVCAVLAGGFLEKSGQGWISAGPGTLRISGGARHDIDFSRQGARCLVLEVNEMEIAQELTRPRFLEPDPWLQSLLERLDRALSAPASPLSVDDLATELVAQASRRVAGRKTPPPPWVDRVRQTVREATEPLAVSDLAAEVGVHRVYLARAFREHCGVSVTGYMRRVRLARAKRLLAGAAPLAEVAALAGFSDQSHMTRSVRAAFGLTPGTLRHGLHAFKTPGRSVR